ncbi:MAG: UxaA family hydrolase [Bacillota bacterium]
MDNRSGFFQINDKDSVVVATKKINKDTVILISDEEVRVNNEILPGHKIAIKKILKGEKVLKYGYPIGIAAQDIFPGDWVHTHNMESSLHGGNSYLYNPQLTEYSKSNNNLYFNGYLRENGLTGIRNHVYLIPMVFCVNGPITKLAEMANLVYPKSENFDGFLPLCHPYGCSQTGKDLEYTQKILANLAKNPNAGAVLIVSLGCEINSLDVFKPYLGEIDEKRIKFLVLQDCEDEFETGIQLLKQLYEYTVSFSRETLSISKLTIGVNCGGSDGLSGITANPLVGKVSNEIIAQGGSVIMTEVPEMFGAEQILMNRAKNQQVFTKIADLIENYKMYFSKYGEEANENPTQGNRAGGITTLEEKSLGCILKGGEAVVEDVIEYGELIKHSGLNLLSGPGNDLVGVTAQFAAGCNLMIFTTGRGTPGGFAGPTLRISTNSQLYERKKHWNDFNAGELLSGENIDNLAARLLDLIIKVASGEVKTMTEKNNYYEIGILRDGVTL